MQVDLTINYGMKGACPVAFSLPEEPLEGAEAWDSCRLDVPEELCPEIRDGVMTVQAGEKRVPLLEALVCRKGWPMVEFVRDGKTISVPLNEAVRPSGPIR